MCALIVIISSWPDKRVDASQSSDDLVAFLHFFINKSVFLIKKTNVLNAGLMQGQRDPRQPKIKTYRLWY